MMHTNKRILKWIGQFFWLLWLFGIASCTQVAGEPTLADIVEVTATAMTMIEPTPTNVIEATVTPAATAEPTLSSTPMVAPTPSLPPGSMSTLPEEFKVIMDPAVCPHACYLGLTTGQTKGEVLAILQTIDAVDIEIDDEEDFDGFTGIDWQWKDWLLPFIYRRDAGIAFRDGYSVFFGVPPRDLVPISLILEEFGEPDYIDAEGDNTGNWSFGLIYFYQGTVVEFGTLGIQLNRPTSLSANTLLQWIIIEEADYFFNLVCEGGWEIKFQEWKGYGGLDVYYDQHGNRLDEVSIVDCADYEQPDPDDE